MAQEIERKFLVDGDFKKEAYDAIRITQGYLSSMPQHVVRVRVKGDKGYITIKGEADASGVSRFEWEKEITLEEAKALLKLAEPGIIDKTRYLIKNADGRHTWEVDVFHGWAVLASGRGRMMTCLKPGAASSGFRPMSVRQIHSPTEPKAQWLKEFMPGFWKPRPAT